MATPKTSLGSAGEAIARGYLVERGYTWVESNWHCRAGEIDLVMNDGAELVFVEVKTRRGEAAGRAEESISVAKGRRLLASGEWYLAEHANRGDPVWRIDLIAVTLDRTGKVERLTHIENAVTVG
jgi:putative endonuclease